MRAWLLLIVIGCGPSAEQRELEEVCRKQRDWVVTQLEMADGRLERLAAEEMPEPADDIDSDLGRIQNAESKVMVEAYTKRRALVAPTRAALTAAAAAWKGEGDAREATAVLAEKMTAFEGTMVPIEQRFQLSKSEAAAVVEKLKAERAVANDRDRTRLDLQIRTAGNHIRLADLWIAAKPGGQPFVHLRRALDDAAKICPR